MKASVSIDAPHNEYKYLTMLQYQLRGVEVIWDFEVGSNIAVVIFPKVPHILIYDDPDTS